MKKTDIILYQNIFLLASFLMFFMTHPGLFGRLRNVFILIWGDPLSHHI